MSMKMKLQAWGELLQRYGAIAGHAWQQRAAMEAVKRLPHEAQFLPAALSLQETPVSPAPRVLMWLLIGFAVLAVLWASLGEIDVVATAQGKVVPNDRTKTIQPFETATVKAIHVRDGQAVRAGEVLIELDGTTSHADLDRIAGDLDAARLQVARGRAMLAALETGKAALLVRTPGMREAGVTEARRLLAGQMAEADARASRIAAETGKREAELRSMQALVRKLEQTLPLAKERAQDFKNLADQKFVSRHGYLEREQSRIEQEADLANLRSRVTETEAALRETQGQRAELRAELRRASLDSITEGQQRAAALEQELLKAHSRDSLMRLVSPVDGTVQQLAVHTVGGVVTEAQPVMIIVPRDNVLEVEAFLENKDIGFVKQQQDAEVKIETFQYTKYGTIRGKVSSVSHDAISDEKRGLIYSTRVTMDKSTLDIDGTPVSLSPGMAVSVEIKTGRRRLIEFFLSPLKAHVRESLRER